jgi:hypothetical protein
MSDTFDGFVPPTKNFFHMPNEWINICARITNLAELKVVQYVLRHTWGYREYDGKPKPITADEFMNGRKRSDGTRIDDGTGLSKPSVIQGLKYAIKNGYLICETDDADKARVIKSYALKMSDTLGVKDLNPQEENGGKDPLPQESSIFTPEVKDLYIQGVKDLYSDQRNTGERQNRKTPKKDSVATNVDVPPTDLLSSLPDQALVNEITRREKEKLENASLIANPTIENVEPEVTPKNVEPVTTRNTSSKPRTPRTKVTQERKTEPLLSEQARRVWDIWLEMPWNKAIPPKLTETAAKHCETLSKVEITSDIIFKVLNFAKKNDKNGFYDGKSKELGHVVSEYARWKSAQYQITSESQKESKPYVRDLAAEHRKMVEQYSKPSAVNAGK